VHVFSEVPTCSSQCLGGHTHTTSAKPRFVMHHILCKLHCVKIPIIGPPQIPPQQSSCLPSSTYSSHAAYAPKIHSELCSRFGMFLAASSPPHSPTISFQIPKRVNKFPCSYLCRRRIILNNPPPLDKIILSRASHLSTCPAQSTKDCMVMVKFLVFIYVCGL